MSAGVLRTELGEAVVRSALWWRDRVSVTPGAAAGQATEWLARPGEPDELTVLARHILALSDVEKGCAASAWQHARSGIELAERRGLMERAAQLRLTLCWVEAERGAVEASWRELAHAVPALRGRDVARAACLRGLLHHQQAHYRRAVAELSVAMGELADDDQRWVANALSGRGMAAFHLGRLRDAADDLAAAESVFAAGGQLARAAACRHNQGCVAYRNGDLPRALRLFDEAAANGLDSAAAPEALVDRAQSQVAAGLRSAAGETVRAAAQRLQQQDRGVCLAETWLELANLALRAGDAQGAAQHACRARRLFWAQHRATWSTLARALYWQARLCGERCSWPVVRAAQRTANACAAAGWRGVAARVWLAAGQCAVRAGWIRRARVLFRNAARLRVERAASAQDRAVGWLAAALMAELADDLTEVLRSCREGLREVQRHLATIPAFELRVREWAAAGDLAAVSMRAALRTGDARVILRWVERLRASALHRQALCPPVDSELRAALVRLRAAARATEHRDRRSRGALMLPAVTGSTTDTCVSVTAVRASRGTGACPIAGQHPEHDVLVPAPRAGDSIAVLERRVQHRAMLVSGRTRGWLAGFGVSDLSARLGESVLLTLFSYDDKLFAVSGVDGLFRVHVLGSRAWVETLVGRLRHALARRVCGPSAEMDAACAAQARDCAHQLQDILLAPVHSALRDRRPLVVLPSGNVHMLPWAELPLCRNRRVTVAPSLRCWLRGATARRGPTARGPVWIAGPGLEHAEGEVTALQRAGGGQLLTGAAATVDRAVRAMEASSVTHIAAHGRFRADQPLLSSLRLGDGPLYAYDLDRLSIGPETVVLSACEVGSSAINAGEQISGVAAMLLNKGTSTVVASVLPVPDERAERVMRTLHAELRNGRSTASALARAQETHQESGFVCLGYGG